MNIIEETYFKCPSCGAEARGIVEINRKFGYNFTEEEIAPHPLCKACRGVDEFGEKYQEGRAYNDITHAWGTATSWGRKIHISGAKFTSYLVDLGYLEKVVPTVSNGETTIESRGQEFLITPKGYTHCRLKQTCLGDIVQWDFDTYAEVVCLRAQMADVHDICPRCRAYLDVEPEYDHLAPSHKCGRCGHVCEEWGVSVTYDR